jgi:hypothetical protein
MTGIFLFSVLAVWLYVVFLVTKIIAKKLPDKRLSVAVRIVLFVLLAPLPLADEIAGGRQFEQLCKEKSAITVDSRDVRGRTVWFGTSQRTQVNLGAIHVTEAKRIYVDVKTQEPIYHYYRLEAKGGWLIRILGISEGNSPLLFTAVCQPKNIETIDAELGITRINRPN